MTPEQLYAFIFHAHLCRWKINQFRSFIIGNCACTLPGSKRLYDLIIVRAVLMHHCKVLRHWRRSHYDHPEWRWCHRILHHWHCAMIFIGCVHDHDLVWFAACEKRRLFLRSKQVPTFFARSSGHSASISVWRHRTLPRRFIFDVAVYFSVAIDTAASGLPDTAMCRLLVRFSINCSDGVSPALKVRCGCWKRHTKSHPDFFR